VNTGWIYLYSGVIMAGISMPLAKLSDGFANLPLGIAAMVLYSGATLCWIMAMKHISLSSAYLIWLGMDAAIMVLFSYFMFHESFSLGKLLCMGLILAGCIGLNMLEVRQR
jgi:multidrug transporter EmrE-like cation transporter